MPGDGPRRVRGKVSGEEERVRRERKEKSKIEVMTSVRYSCYMYKNGVVVDGPGTVSHVLVLARGK
jgi:hypothetical protein